MGVVDYKRFDIVLVSLDPSLGTEIQKTRPCLIISPNEMNKFLQTVIIAPMTTVIRNYPSRILINFQGKKGNIALDQIRTIDKSRIVGNLGKIDNNKKQKEVLDLLVAIFSM